MAIIIKNNYPDFDIDIKENIKPKIIVDNSIDFKVLFNVLLKNKIYIFLVTLLFAGIGTGTSFFLKKYYNAEISLYPAKKDISQGLGQFQSLAANLGMNTSNSDQGFNIPDVVKSRLIANKAINQKWKTKNN